MRRHWCTDSVVHEVVLAREAAARAALDALGDERSTEAGHILARDYEAWLQDSSGRARAATGINALRRRLLHAERACLAQLLQQDQIGDHAFHEVEDELYWLDAELHETE